MNLFPRSPLFVRCRSRCGRGLVHFMPHDLPRCCAYAMPVLWLFSSVIDVSHRSLEDAPVSNTPAYLLYQVWSPRSEACTRTVLPCSGITITSFVFMNRCGTFFLTDLSPTTFFVSFFSRHSNNNLTGQFAVG